MSWNKKEEAAEEKKELYSEEDYRKFVEMRKPYKANRRINGVLSSAFEHMLHDLHTITVNEKHNRFVVHDPEGFTKLNVMNSRYEMREYHEQEQRFKQFPAEKEAQTERIKNLRQNLAAKLSS
jgi:hypothetical protein